MGYRSKRKAEKERLAQIRESREARAALKKKYGSGGLPSSYKQSEEKAFEKAKEWKAANPEVTHLNAFGLTRDGKDRHGRREELPKNLRYPYSTIDSTQDFIKFSIFKYRRGALVTRSDDDLKSKLLGSILLPIPANLVDSNNANYKQGDMNFLQEAGMKFGAEALSGQMEKAGGTVNDLVGSIAGNKNLIKNYFATQAMNSIGGNLSLDQILARSSGQIINPNMELLFSGPSLRNFSYQFKFTPRFQKEAESVRTIIKAFKRNMAPKGAGSNFLKTPNIFEIQYVGDAADYLNRIKLCALKNVAMNYTGDGTWATYSDGSPISMTMTLAFTELTPIYNEDYLDYDNHDDGVGY
jgi:hypothetical protein